MLPEAVWLEGNRKGASLRRARASAGGPAPSLQGYPIASLAALSFLPMSSAKPTEHYESSKHIAGTMNSLAKDWFSSETAAQPLASQSMGSREGVSE
eukprot:1009371-Pyramimonas_sp.AAC.1